MPKKRYPKTKLPNYKKAFNDSTRHLLQDYLKVINRYYGKEEEKESLLENFSKINDLWEASRFIVNYGLVCTKSQRRAQIIQEETSTIIRVGKLEQSNLLKPF